MTSKRSAVASASPTRSAVSAELGAVLELLVAAIADRVVERLSTDNDGWTAQDASPLGPRRHRAAVNRRLATGLPGASKVGRRLLLNREALNEELAALNLPTEPVSRDDAEILRKLGLGGSR